MDEVNVDAIDRRDELRKAIQLLLHPSPVVACAPIANQRLQLRQLRALLLIGDGFLVGPARGPNAPAKVIELGRRNIPFVKYGGLKFLEAAHVKDVVFDPLNVPRVSRILPNAAWAQVVPPARPER